MSNNNKNNNNNNQQKHKIRIPFPYRYGMIFIVLLIIGTWFLTSDVYHIKNLFDSDDGNDKNAKDDNVNGVGDNVIGKNEGSLFPSLSRNNNNNNNNKQQQQQLRKKKNHTTSSRSRSSRSRSSSRLIDGILRLESEEKSDKNRIIHNDAGNGSEKQQQQQQQHQPSDIISNNITNTSNSNPSSSSSSTAGVHFSLMDNDDNDDNDDDDDKDRTTVPAANRTSTASVPLLLDEQQQPVAIEKEELTLLDDASDDTLSSLDDEDDDESEDWMNTSGIELKYIIGDPDTCTDVIYTGDTRVPSAPSSLLSSSENSAAATTNYGISNLTFYEASWIGLQYIVNQTNANANIAQAKKNNGNDTAPDSNATNNISSTALCLVFFQIPNPYLITITESEDEQQQQQQQQEEPNTRHTQRQREIEIHPVWARIPATALIMSTFANANYFLYLDTDAVLSFNHEKAVPSVMYKALSYDGYGENATYAHKYPGLIVNKPATGWMCSQCQDYNLREGCFNTGALLWRRSDAAAAILRAWWESKDLSVDANFFRTVTTTTTTTTNGVANVTSTGTVEAFPFWDEGTIESRLQNKMSEQTRLYWIYANHPSVGKASSRGAGRHNDSDDMIWVVPQQRSDEFNSLSCPNGIRNKMPCLQYDAPSTVWYNRNIDENENEESCFINHYTDRKEYTLEHLQLILHN